MEKLRADFVTLAKIVKELAEHMQKTLDFEEEAAKQIKAMDERIKVLEAMAHPRIKEVERL